MKDKKSILWTLGHIGAHDNGIELIKETSIIKDIVEMAENDPVLSLRGTCIYIIGMLCRTKPGRREIQKQNWFFSQAQVASGADSICLPRDSKKLFTIAGSQFKGSMTLQKQVLENTKSIKTELPLSKEEQETLDLIGMLINGVTWKQAYNELTRAQEKQSDRFVDPKLFEHVLLYLSTYPNLQPKNRKFIFNLFDQLIFKDKLLKQKFVHI
jgi:rapamycin-insensitive companion of mTOR